MQSANLRSKGDLEYLQFNAFSASGKVTHAFTTRRGGVSSVPYQSLNLALHVGDNPEDVITNRALLCDALDIDAAHLVAAVQVHGCRVEVVESRHRGRGALTYDTAFPDTDALITNIPGVPLSSYYADCVPIMLFDPAQVAVGLAHAGWRGTVQSIAGLTVEGMVKAFGCKPNNILAVIGPSIGPCCYQVDLPVQQTLAEAFPYWQELVKPVTNGYWNLNLWETNRRVLLAAGIRQENITVASLCTNCYSNMFFSYRAEQGTTGRMASVIMIRP